MLIKARGKTNLGSALNLKGLFRLRGKRGLKSLTTNGS